MTAYDEGDWPDAPLQWREAKPPVHVAVLLWVGMALIMAITCWLVGC